MRILQLKTSATVGGAETTLVDLTKGVIERGHQMLTVFGERGPLVNRFDAERFPHLVLDIPPFRVPWAMFRLWRLMATYEPDVVLCHGARMNVVAMWPAAWRGVPTIGVEHNIDGWRTNGRIFRKIDRAVARTNVGRLTVADAVSRMLIDDGIMPSAKVKTISNILYRPSVDAPLDRAQVRRAFAIRDDQQAIAVVARLAEQKGHATLLTAVSQLACREQVKFVLFGDGPLRDSLVRTASELGVGDLVTFAGMRTNITALLPAFDIFVLPSLWEGLPIAVLEAMTVGVPVIATAVAATPEVVKDGETGLLVPPGHSEALAAAICRLVSDAGLRRRLAAAAAARVHGASGQEGAWVDAYLDAINELMPKLGDRRS